MAFPNEIIEFPTMLDITESDGALIAQYQSAIKEGDMETAAEILLTIPSYEQKIITANYLNSIGQTVQALESFFLDRYNPAYVVSSSQPALQHTGDFWFQLTDED